jgi:hypothetical protein
MYKRYCDFFADNGAYVEVTATINDEDVSNRGVNRVNVCLRALRNAKPIPLG